MISCLIVIMHQFCYLDTDTGLAVSIPVALIILVVISVLAEVLPPVRSHDPYGKFGPKLRRLPNQTENCKVTHIDYYILEIREVMP